MNDNGQSNTLRGCVPDRLSVSTVFESLPDSIQHICNSCLSGLPAAVACAGILSIDNVAGMRVLL
jgi:hypothetical protein